MKNVFDKFILWMQYNRPEYASADEWVNFTRTFKKNAPVRYFVIEKLPIPFKLLKWKIERNLLSLRYRTVDRYHVIKTDLSPGYHDPSDQMLHACFSLLVDYVEIGCATRFRFCDRQEYKRQLGFRRFIPYYLDFFSLRKVRNVEAGLKYLQWETTVTEPVTQAERAKEVIELYNWWKNVRSQRKDLEYPIVEKKNDHVLVTMTEEWRETHPEDHQKIQEWAKKYNQLEQEWLNEDQEMLMRLVKIRSGLWV